jgi:3-dehydroquinate dehydratase/shikimate dehydrogenase
MAKICLCLTGKTIQRELELIEKYRPYIDIAELRVDFLEDEERFSIRRFPSLAGMPVILTVRRQSDGGQFTDSESSRIVLLSKGLAFAEADIRQNFAYVDLEEDIDVPGLEEAARAYRTQIIRSFHDFNGGNKNIAARVRNLSRAGDEILKAAVKCDTLYDVIDMYQASRELSDKNKILICMGSTGLCTRVLAEKFGSSICFTSAKNEPDFPLAGPGQIDPIELTNLYRFRSLDKDSKIYGILGYPLLATSSPPFFNHIFDIENQNAVYIPFPSEEAEPFIKFAEELNILGASVTFPHKENVTRYLTEPSEKVSAIGACNTMVRASGGWHGYNADAQGFSDSLLNFIGKKDLRGKRITIVGAGGVSRAVTSEVHRLKGKALILNRNKLKAEKLAGKYGFEWSGIDSAGLRLTRKFSDVIIQTTSAGMEPDVDTDPLWYYDFSGREYVMDLIYKPEQTLFLRRAAAAGCSVLNGYDMLMRQAKLQYQHFFGKPYPHNL